MKITLPESIKDITLNQYQKFHLLSEQLENKEISEREFIKRKISLFSGIPYVKIDDVVHNDLSDVMAQIDKALNEDSKFEKFFTLNNIEFGFVENLDKITSGEYFDLNKYGTKEDTLHNLMAILFRPIKTKDKFGNYKVKKYKGTSEYAELMKQLPMNIVNGSLVFFCNLSRELQNHILKYTKTEREKERLQANTLVNGVGTQPSMN